MRKITLQIIITSICLFALTSSYAQQTSGYLLKYSTPPTHMNSIIKEVFGKIGINTPTPISTLDVNGSFHVMSDAAFDGSLYLKASGPSSNNIFIGTNGLNFLGGPSQSSQITIMSINAYTPKVRFNYGIVTNGFKLETNPGLNKVLVSDGDGNGTWTSIGDLTINDNDWIRNGQNDLYSNCRFVGIGTVAPTRELDVIGDIALSGAIYGKPSGHASNKLQLYGSANTNAGYVELGDGTPGWNCVKLLALGENGYVQLWADKAVSMEIRSKDIIVGGIYNQVDLKVNGKIFSKEVKVSLTDWSDIVFADDYCLMPLKDVDSFIKLNNHLPEIPSEKEVLENGINVGEMNALLLKKIEELTLYIIDQQKQIDELKICIQK